MADKPIIHTTPPIPYDPTEKTVEISDEEWSRLLTASQYKVIRKQGTERAFQGQYADFHEDGTYICAACANPLFDSSTKYESGSGWPSFFSPLDEDSIKTQEDDSLFSKRTEVLCKRCSGHLGHLFDDGPPPTGLRYCMNSISLSFITKHFTK